MTPKKGAPAAVSLFLILADVSSFFLSGTFALLIAIQFDKASFDTFNDLLTLDEKSRVMDYAIWSILWVVWFGPFRDRYRRRIPFWAETIEATRTIAILALAHLSAISLTHHDFSRSIWLVGWVTLVMMLPIMRSFARGIMKRLGMLSLPLYVIGEGPNARHAQSALLHEWQMGLDFQRFVSLAEVGSFSKKPPNDGRVQPTPVYAVALEEEESSLINRIVTELSLAGVTDIYVIPSYRGLPLQGAELSFFFSEEVLMLRIRNNLEPRISRWVKRGFDLSAGLLLLAPSLFLIGFAAILVKWEDGGPIFFVQERLGKGGRLFRMLKIRTMSLNAESQLQVWKRDQSAEWSEYVENGFKLKHDPRLLRFGGFLRAFSIDELPQILNVLKGDMSLVGPRPILPRETLAYGDDLPLYESSVPGVTGLWQVSGRSQTSFAERAALDAWYIRNWSLVFDFILLLKTIRVVLGKQGAY